MRTQHLQILLLLIVLLPACGKGKSATAVVPAASSAGAAAEDAQGIAATGDDAGEAMDAREAALWEAAKGDADPEELMRLADLVGCEGMKERSEQQQELRPVALAAMQYCHDFAELPWLAQVGTEGSDADARSALQAAVALAARPRASVDPEDADDLHAGCGTLLTLAKTPDRPRERRVLAIRALRMLAEYGCVKAADVPTDLDAR